ncbi:hypothetical protein RQP46_008900 [Phenoliferia psychrophenolica]
MSSSDASEPNTTSPPSLKTIAQQALLDTLELDQIILSKSSPGHFSPDDLTSMPLAFFQQGIAAHAAVPITRALLDFLPQLEGRMTAIDHHHNSINCGDKPMSHEITKTSYLITTDDGDSRTLVIETAQGHFDTNYEGESWAGRHMMAREKRSSTKYGRSYQEEEAQSDDDDELRVASGSRPLKRHIPADDSEDEDLAPAKKAKRTVAAPAPATKGKTKGRLAKLAKFSSMPLDILSEICSHLDPLSLLYMSRTTKSIHRLLTSKGSRALWISARRTVALPDLAAEDMTEMAYASLVFERNCMVCGKGRSSKHDYAIRARFCQPCHKANVVYENKAAGAIPDLHHLALACSPFTHYSPAGGWFSGRHYIFIPDVKKISEQLHALMTEHDRILAERDAAKPQTRKGKGKAKALNQDLSTSAGSEDIFIRKSQASVTTARDDAKLINTWEDTRIKDRKIAARAASKQCSADVDAKMVALGYELEDFEGVYSMLYSHSKPLTDRSWKNIAPEIKAAADENMYYRLMREADDRRSKRKRLINPLYSSILDAWPMDSKLHFPSFIDFCQLPSAKAFWSPEGVEIEDAAWNAALPSIEADIRAHQVTRRRKELILRSLNPQVNDAPVDPNLVTFTELDAPDGRGFAYELNVNGCRIRVINHF